MLFKFKRVEKITIWWIALFIAFVLSTRPSTAHDPAQHTTQQTTQHSTRHSTAQHTAHDTAQTIRLISMQRNIDEIFFRTTGIIVQNTIENTFFPGKSLPDFFLPPK